MVTGYLLLQLHSGIERRETAFYYGCGGPALGGAVTSAISASSRSAPWTGPSIVKDGPDQHFSYVAYIYDLWAGSPTVWMASPTGGEFRAALNDPTLPAVAAPAEVPFIGQTTPSLHYGETAPPLGTVAPAKR